MHGDLVQRRFTADAPNQVCLTDITEHATAEGKLYLCAIKNVYSGRIVGYSIDSRIKVSLAVTALRNAARLRGPAGTIVHSDRGSQIRSRKFVKALHRNGLVGSMGRVGAFGEPRERENPLRAGCGDHLHPGTLDDRPQQTDTGVTRRPLVPRIADHFTVR